MTTFRALALCLAFFVLQTPNSADAQVLDGNFVFMSSCIGASCDTTPAPNCNLSDQACATTTVANLRAVGARHFLLPPQADSLATIQHLAAEIDRVGLKFYVYEGWAWGIDEGASCSRYATRINTVLLPLLAAYPNSFAGIQLKDEPTPGQLASLKNHAACLRAHPALANLKLFLNLSPLDSNQLSGTIPPNQANYLQPEQYGFGNNCAAGGITNPGAAANQVGLYTSYVTTAANDIRPDYLATDIYPFNSIYAACPAAREFVMSEGLSILAAAANLRGITPIAYTQNTESTTPPMFYGYAHFHRLRWFTSWFYALGGKGISNYRSNDYVFNGQHLRGILDNNNNPTRLFSDAQSTFGFTLPMQIELSKHPFKRFVAPFLAANSGSIVGWMPSNDVLVGEYGTADDNEVMLFFARRYPDQSASIAHGQIGFTRWWSKVERYGLSPVTGAWTWQVVGVGTNTTSVDLSTFPGALYRLTR
jgi:hypothetical protein